MTELPTINIESHEEGQTTLGEKCGESRMIDTFAAVSTYRETKKVRRLLFIAGQFAVLLGGLLLWLNSGRYIVTEDAYVKADKVVISAQISGLISAMAVSENQPVIAGDELIRIDDRAYRIALRRAEAELETVANEFDSVKVSLRQKEQELRLARVNLEFAQRELQRQSELAKKKLSSQAVLDEAEFSVVIAQQKVRVTEESRAQYLARLKGNPDLPLSEYPAYLSAKANREAAALDLARTVIRAPFAGIASKLPQLGQYVHAGGAVMSIVGTREIWIEANSLETDLMHVQVGQSVSVEIDAYPGHRWRGYVQSISQATGAEFSVLPPQNATGNWVKIVQRVPMRIAIDSNNNDPPLRMGMTATVEIDTGARRSLKGLLKNVGNTLGVVTADADPAS